MPATAYLAPPRPISLYSVLDATTSMSLHPALDLDWEPFQNHVEAFLNAIDSYTLSAKTEIAARATDHVTSVRDLKAEKEEMERRIQLEREREGDMLATLENERHTLTDLTASLTHLQTTLTRVKEQSTALEAELNAVRKEVKSQKMEKERQTTVLEEMRGQDGVELGLLEEAIGWRVEGVKEDLLLMRFTSIDPAEPEREFSIVIDVSKQDYSVPKCSPPLANLAEMVRQLNSDREFFGFIKRVRKAFRALIPNPPNPSAKFNDLAGPGLRATEPSSAKTLEDGTGMDGTRVDGTSM
ncbi:MAG: kinetochore-associated Ndc80 complex subunit spc25 [Tremellales sp. Tagirdzhanova-0007]|nr:MAG: kinetochore-associated Ndc80 complex subunit spc25 [Tremellales sp. Tagirdzhanova-0007]